MLAMISIVGRQVQLQVRGAEVKGPWCRLRVAVVGRLGMAFSFFLFLLLVVARRLRSLGICLFLSFPKPLSKTNLLLIPSKPDQPSQPSVNGGLDELEQVVALTVILCRKRVSTLSI